MKTYLLALLLLFPTTSGAGRAWTQRDCTMLAKMASTGAIMRDNEVPLPEVLKALHRAADVPDNLLLRYDGDYDLVESIVVASYKSKWKPEIVYQVVWAQCDRMGLSKTVRDL